MLDSLDVVVVAAFVVVVFSAVVVGVVVVGVACGVEVVCTVEVSVSVVSGTDVVCWACSVEVGVTNVVCWVVVVCWVGLERVLVVLNLLVLVVLAARTAFTDVLVVACDEDTTLTSEDDEAMCADDLVLHWCAANPD